MRNEIDNVEPDKARADYSQYVWDTKKSNKVKGFNNPLKRDRIMTREEWDLEQFAKRIKLDYETEEVIYDIHKDYPFDWEEDPDLNQDL
jgi:hypothetical protein